MALKFNSLLARGPASHLGHYLRDGMTSYRRQMSPVSVIRADGRLAVPIRFGECPRYDARHDPSAARLLWAPRFQTENSTDNPALTSPLKGF